VQWIDPTSLEGLGRTVDRIRTLPTLLIVTFRPEFNAPWVGQSHVTSLTLNRLGQREVAAIIARLVGNKELPADVMAEIVERTDGIPLFVEEMTKAVLEAENEGAARRTVAAARSQTLEVPASLRASLIARLDRLGPTAKEIVQIGAAIGRDFSYELLAMVAQRTEPELDEAMARLVDRGLVFAAGTKPQATFLFKHALVQETAYSLLLRAARKALHARIAYVLEERFRSVVEARPQVLAHHFTEAGLVDQAVAYWSWAGQQSAMKSGFIEAIAHLRRGMRLIAELPDSRERKQRELELQVNLAAALMEAKGRHPLPRIRRRRHPQTRRAYGVVNRISVGEFWLFGPFPSSAHHLVNFDGKVSNDSCCISTIPIFG